MLAVGRTAAVTLAQILGRTAATDRSGHYLIRLTCRSPGPLCYLPRQRRGGIARGTL